MATSMDDFLRAIQERYNGNFQPYSAGTKRYGASGRDAPNIGPTTNREGYAERDRLAKVRRDLMLRRMRATQSGNFMDPAYLQQPIPGTFRM